VVRVERSDHRQPGTQWHILLPDSGAEARDRVRASASWRRSFHARSYDIPGSDERLRPEAHSEMRTRFAAACAILLFAASSHAHRLDEYLQATTLSLDEDRVQANIRLIPGVAVFPVVLATIDTDSDGILSEAEQRAYAERVHRDLSLTTNGERLRFRLISWTFPNLDTLKEGLGEIQLEFDAHVPRRASSRRLVFENHHQSAIGTYLVNCLVPRDEAIRITAQSRNRDQSLYQLDYLQAGTHSASVLADWWTGPWSWADTAALLLLAGVAVLSWRYAVAPDSVAKE
jgi:hypothetical protein